MSAPTEVDIETTRGDTHLIKATVVDPDDGSAVDLTTAVIRYKLAKSVTATTVNISKTVGAGITVTDGPAGKMEIRLDQTETALLAGDFYHECEVKVDGNVYTVFTGKISFTKDLVI